ncbi:MAG: hypothetical protein S4CHLAM102_05400 [Chlamydiia bacterium]|nr:hypothetical protein [Chlamydiia bacterium]
MNCWMWKFLCLLTLCSYLYADEVNCECFNPKDHSSLSAERGPGYYLSGDLLLFVADEGGIGMATTGVPTSRATPSITSGKVLYPKVKIKPGFKVDAGWVSCHDGWDVFGQYMWFQSNQRRHTVESNEMVALFNPEPQTSYMTFVDSVEGRWFITSNTVDVGVGRKYWNSPYLSMRPHLGLKGAWQLQKLKVQYLHTNSTIESNIKMWQNFWGVGPQFGLQGTFYWTNVYSAYGNFSLSALWSRFHNEYKNQTRAANSNDEFTWNGLTDSEFYNVSPVMSIALGLRYDTWSTNRDYHFLVQGGWELQEWWSQNNFNTIYNNGVQGDLSFQGFTLKVRCDF